MAEAAETLIPLDAAVACVWPHSDADPRLHLRILPGPLTSDQRAWLLARGGHTTILDPVGSGDIRQFWQLHGAQEGWHDAAEIRREFGRVDCPGGEYFRLITKQVGDAP